MQQHQHQIRRRMNVYHERESLFAVFFAKPGQTSKAEEGKRHNLHDVWWCWPSRAQFFALYEQKKLIRRGGRACSGTEGCLPGTTHAISSKSSLTEKKRSKHVIVSYPSPRGPGRK